MKSQKKVEPLFAICIKNTNYSASLELRKIYPVISDSEAAKHDLIRIKDESGEDYLYPKSFFLKVSLLQTVQKALQKAS